jgi:hypothetical protein
MLSRDETSSFRNTYRNISYLLNQPLNPQPFFKHIHVMAVKMQSFRTNDGITLKYVDTAATDAQVAKETLILVRFSLASSVFLYPDLSAQTSGHRVIPFLSWNF